MRAVATFGLVGLAGCTAVVVRRRHAKQQAAATTGSDPSVRADDGTRLHVSVEGRADASVTAVLVHGFGASMEEYARQRGALGRNFRLVLFDQRGHGRSGWGSFGSATLPRLGRDVGEVVDQCGGAGPVVLVGHSMGAMAILALAASRPQLFGDKVAAVALLSASAGGVVPGLSLSSSRVVVGTGLLQLLGWSLWLVAPITERLGALRTARGRQLLRHFLFGGEPSNEELDAVHDMWLGTSRDMAAALYPGMLAHDTTAAFEALGRIPCLVLAGAEDRTIAPRHANRIAESIGPSARLLHVAGAGHMVNLTHPQEVNEAIECLLETAATRRGP